MTWRLGGEIGLQERGVDKQKGLLALIPRGSSAYSRGGVFSSHSTTNAVAENETNSGKGAEETRKAKNLKKNGRGVWNVRYVEKKLLHHWQSLMFIGGQLII